MCTNSGNALVSSGRGFRRLGLLAVVLAGCNGGGGSASGGPTETFTAHGISLTASTTRTPAGLVTTVSKDGVIQLRIVLRVDGVTMDFTGGTGPSDYPFATPLDGLPTDYAANLLATYVVAGAQTPSSSRLDSPGCDWFPDTQCTLGCCAQHDRCYQENACSFTSWLGVMGTPACDNCNHIAASCITAACAGVEDSSTNDRCYDNRCQQFYDCDGSTCACGSPCDEESPPTCGNGSCEVMETPDNCAGDCWEGAGVNQCCVASDGCLSETQTSCPGDCCCCGEGEVCNLSSSLCAPSR